MSSPFFIEPQPEKVGVLFLYVRRVRKLGSSPFFIEPQPEKVGFFFFYTYDVFASSVRRLSLNPHHVFDGDFFVL